MKVIQPRFTHTVGVQVAVPFAHDYVPTPNTPPLEIAYHKGHDTARRGLDSGTCPYGDGHPNLRDEWMRGHRDAATKANAGRRLKSGSEPGPSEDQDGDGE